MKSISITLAFIFSVFYSFGQLNSKFSTNEVQEDLTYLYQSLKDAHYNLYAYTTEQKFDSVYKKVQQTIAKDSLSLLETTNAFQQLVSAVNNGHTEIDFPGQSYGAYAHANGTVFPLEIAFEYDKALVRKNWSSNTEIFAGSELMSVNGMLIADILEKMYPQISAERPYFKKTKIELYSFPRYYWQIFGEQDEFEVEIRSKGNIKTYILKAIHLIQDYEMKREEILNSQMKLAFFKHSAYLNPGHFSGDETKFRHFIDSAFAKIKEQKSKNLIIDLRNNGGGNDSFSDYLVSYFASKPFKWNSSFKLKTSRFLKEHVRKYRDTTKVFWEKVLSHKNGEIYDHAFAEYQPQSTAKRFTGKVFVLVNRQSHSQSAVTAAQVQDYNFGTIVGEETGDYPSLYASQFQYTLPNTGIPVKVSKGYIVRVNGSTAKQGVVPDIFIKDHLLDENDEILDGLLDKLSKAAK
ncbi:S41 family peptidase [Flagellimonas sp.]|uniref:S41 family peptidase n=1 Tax=Flagellimonas sp. TaxID=2058762 RepID=UPI003B50577A